MIAGRQRAILAHLGPELAALNALPAEERRAVLATLAPERAELLAEAAGVVSLRRHAEQVDPGPRLTWRHVGAMMEQLQRVLDGEITRLMIHAPRRYHKSRTVVQDMASCAIRNAVAAASGDLAESYYVALMFASDKWARYHSGKAREKILRAGIELRADTKDKSLWEVAGLPVGMWTTTIMGSQLGAGYRLGIIDDPIGSYEDAARRVVQEAAINAIDSFAESADKGGAPVARVVMFQRLSARDPAELLYERELDAAKAEGWTVLSLPAESRPRRVSFPPSCEVIADWRQPGEPLCPELESLEEIRKRAAANPRRAAAMDGQEPMSAASGGIFRASWLPIIGEGRDDLDKPLEAVVNMHREGLIAKPRRVLRGHDFSGGGADAVASVGLYLLEPGSGIDEILFDPTEAHPPAAGVKDVALANAWRDNSTTVEQAIPKETGVGGTFTAHMRQALRDFTVHATPVGKGKVALAQPLAAACAPSCRKCACLVVERAELGPMAAEDVCRCDEPDVRPGKVAILAGPNAVSFREELHSFDGEGVDHRVDAAACAHNAANRREIRPINWGAL